MFRLALALGKTVHEIESTMPASELLEWQTFARDEPFGDIRADLRAGVVARTVAQAFGGNRKATSLDFMPVVKREFEKAEQENAANIAARFNAMMFAQSKNVRIMPRKKVN